MQINLEKINLNNLAHQESFNELMQDKDINGISALRRLHLSYFIKIDDNVIGLIGLDGFMGGLAINYGILNEFRGQKHALNASKILIENLFDENIAGVYGIIQWDSSSEEKTKSNRASRKILVDLGFIDYTDYDYQEGNMIIYYKHNPNYNKTWTSTRFLQK